ncbi:MAG TPA: RNA polymerase sigma factor, partial [Planctomycetota bacterium]|nr:RNA polymerase sigma factor [Planctomycetota bacterium]
LYRHAANYRPQGTFEAFALRIARNAWIDRRRRDATRVSARPFSAIGPQASGLGVQAAHGVEPERRMAQREEQRRIARALSVLSEDHALIFELAIVQARPYQEIAEELAIPVGTVKSRVFHALRRMRAALEAPESSRAPQPRAKLRATVLPEPLAGPP